MCAYSISYNEFDDSLLNTLSQNKDEYTTKYFAKDSKQHNKHNKVAHVNIV